MFKVKYGIIPKTFVQYFSTVKNKYKTRHSEKNFKLPKVISKQTNFRISYRGSYLWNNFLRDKGKNIDSLTKFKIHIKQQLLSRSSEQSFFFKD